MHTYQAFGLTITTDRPLPGLRAAPESPAALLVAWAGDAGGQAWSGTELPPVWQTRFPDGSVVTAELGVGGDQRLAYGDRATFVIYPGADAVSCDLRDGDEPASLRFLLDTVLWWVCLSRGMHLLHAGAVELDAGVFAVAGRTGAGKTSLSVELLRRGHRLFSDDVVVFERADPAPIAHPGPRLMNVPDAVGDIGEWASSLAAFPDQGETWTEIDRGADRPAPIRGIVLLTRAQGLEFEAVRVEPTALDLMPYLWALPHATDARRASFDALSDLAGSTAVYRLSAGLDISAATLAARVESIASGEEPFAHTAEGTTAR